MNDFDKLEKMRKNIVLKKRVMFFCNKVNSIFLIIFSMCFVVMFIVRDMETFMIISIFLFLPLYVSVAIYILLSHVINADVIKYTNMFKNVITYRLFNEIFTGVVYNPNIGFEKSVIEETLMAKIGDIYDSSDYVCAKYKNVNFQMSNARIVRVYHSSDGDQYKTMFFGQWLILDFNKKIVSDVQVVEKNFWPFSTDANISKLDLQKVETEDALFNEIFNIYAENEYDTFYVLTPHIMEKIIKLREIINKKLLFCFSNNKLYIGIQNDRFLFTHNIDNELDLEQEKNNIIRDMKIITDFVDILDLDINVFN